MIDLNARATLWHGDCLKLMAELPPKSVDAIFADLPYGTTDCSWDSIIDLEALWKQYRRIIKPRGAIVLTASPPFTFVLGASNLKGFKHAWVWNKKQCGNPFLAKHGPMKITEDVLVFGKPSAGVNYYPKMTKGKLLYNAGNALKREDFAYSGIKRFKSSAPSDQRYPQNIVTILNPRRGKFHQTEKPVPLFRYFMETYSKPGDLVMDNCFGSGASGVAAVELERRYLGMELKRDFFDYGEERIGRVLGGAHETPPEQAEQLEFELEILKAA
jgi:site-specific DNA-methyltransferase (adenine-specific)